MSSLIRERSREVVVPPNAPPSELAPAERTARVRSLGLTGRLLVLTIGSVLLVLALFYTTRLSAARENWLRDRLCRRADRDAGFRSRRPGRGAA